MQRDGGCYNAQITDTIFVIADEPQHRGPGAFCNDNTVNIDAHGTVHPPQKKANATLVWTIPNDHYLDDWANGRNDGSAFQMYVELVCDVDTDEEISVHYGTSQFWNDSEQGTRMSHPITIM